MTLKLYVYVVLQTPVSIVATLHVVMKVILYIFQRFAAITLLAHRKIFYNHSSFVPSKSYFHSSGLSHISSRILKIKPHNNPLLVSYPSVYTHSRIYFPSTSLEPNIPLPPPACRYNSRNNLL